MSDEATKNVWVSTVLAQETKDGRVQVTWGRERDQLNPESARQIARQLMEGADAAEMDEALLKYLTEGHELEEAQALAFIRDFREFRMGVMERNIAAAMPPTFTKEGGEA